MSTDTKPTTDVTDLTVNVESSDSAISKESSTSIVTNKTSPVAEDPSTAHCDAQACASQSTETQSTHSPVEPHSLESVTTPTEANLVQETSLDDVMDPCGRVPEPISGLDAAGSCNVVSGNGTLPSAQTESPVDCVKSLEMEEITESLAKLSPISEKSALSDITSGVPSADNCLPATGVVCDVSGDNPQLQQTETKVVEKEMPHLEAISVSPSVQPVDVPLPNGTAEVTVSSPPLTPTEVSQASLSTAILQGGADNSDNTTAPTADAGSPSKSVAQTLAENLDSK